MPALVLSLAILAEVIATICLKASHGMTRPGPAIVVVLGYGASFYLLAIVLRSMEASVAYAVWAGAGTALITAIGFVALGETVTMLKMGGMMLIVLGVVTLNLGGAH